MTVGLYLTVWVVGMLVVVGMVKLWAERADRARRAYLRSHPVPEESVRWAACERDRPKNPKDIPLPW